jgi:hypothetical protein
MIVEEQKKLEQNKREEPMSPAARTAITGLFGGMFWSFLGYICYVFNFTEIPPNVIFDPIAVGDWKNGILSQYIAIAILGLISILVAFAYFATLRKFKELWVSLLFGLILWGIVFVILNPIFIKIDPVRELDLNTLVTTICLYALYGTFIGYSISFEETELRMQEEATYSNE